MRVRVQQEPNSHPHGTVGALTASPPVASCMPASGPPPCPLCLLAAGPLERRREGLGQAKGLLWEEGQ